MEHIHKKKAENLRSKQLAWVFLLEHRCRRLHIKLNYCSDQAEARRIKVKQSRLRREERIKQKREELLKQYAKEDDATAKTAK